MHNANEVWLPPPEPGIVQATLAANDRMAALARGCVGAGEVVRMRQPIDLHRFSPQGHWPRNRPQRVLLIGNYFNTPAQRVDQLKAAWKRPGLEWRRIGSPHPTTNVAQEMADADIVVGYGRSILEAMACGRPAYIHEHCGSDGWVTADAYERMEADGFSGAATRLTPSVETLRRDFLAYDPSLGRLGHDLARRHDARLVVAELVAWRVGSAMSRPLTTASPWRGLRNLAEADFAPISKSAGCVSSCDQRPRRNRLRREAARVVFQIGRLFAELASSGWARAKTLARRGVAEPKEIRPAETRPSPSDRAASRPRRRGVSRRIRRAGAPSSSCARARLPRGRAP